MHFRSICLSGGGVTGIAHVGVLKKLQDEGLVGGIDTVIGSSAGAIVGALFAIGMAPEDMFRFLVSLDRDKIFRFNNFDLFFTEFGLDDGRYFLAYMSDIFLRCKVDPRITFAEVQKRFKKRLIVTGTNSSAHQPEYFSVDNHPDMRILDAVRISMSIPFIFTAIRRENGVFVDGGVRDNYPIDYCLHDFHQRHPLTESIFGVVGCYLDSLPPKTTPDLESHIFNLFASTMKRTRDELHTVNVLLTDLSSMDFDADEELLKEACDEGYRATGAHLASLRKKARQLISRRRSL